MCGRSQFFFSDGHHKGTPSNDKRHVHLGWLSDFCRGFVQRSHAEYRVGREHRHIIGADLDALQAQIDTLTVSVGSIPADLDRQGNIYERIAYLSDALNPEYRQQGRRHRNHHRPGGRLLGDFGHSIQPLQLSVQIRIRHKASRRQDHSVRRLRGLQLDTQRRSDYHTRSVHGLGRCDSAHSKHDAAGAAQRGS